jgi:Predicted signal transduction protein with a C-terminal ATPase domain
MIKKQWKRFCEKYMSRISVQLTLLFLLVFFIVVAAGFIIQYIGIEKLLSTNSENNSVQRFRQCDYNISSFCGDVDNISRQIVIDAPFLNLIGSSGLPENEKVYSAYMELKTFTNILNNYHYIRSILYYGSDGLIIRCSGTQNSVNLDEEDKNDWFYTSAPYRKVKNNHQGLTWFGGYTEKSFGMEDKSGGSDYDISAARYLNVGNYSGMLVINTELNYFTSVYNHAGDVDGGSMYLIDGDNKIISSKDKSEIGRKSDILSRLKGGKVNTNFIMQGKSGQEQVVLYRLTKFDGTLVSEVPLRIITKDITDLRNTLLIIFMLSFVLAALIFRFSIARMMKPLIGMTGIIRKIGKGNLGLTFENPPRNELGVLIGQFNRMSANIKMLFDRNTEVEAEKRELEIQTLRNQINPHFIYNTLNTIKWMAVIDGKQNIVESITTFSELLEPIFKRQDVLCMIDEELRYLKNYIKIMNYRFSGGVELETDIPADLLDCRIIRFILQPIVENAIIHGLINRARGKITIRIRSEGNDLLVLVADDGDGIDREMLEEIRLRLAGGGGADGPGIGLVNVDKRLKLHFGNGCGVTVRNGTGGGTEVLLKMPRVLNS